MLDDIRSIIFHPPMNENMEFPIRILHMFIGNSNRHLQWWE